ncbi:MAG: hypothetical protein QOJ26_1207 [Thermoplasmata archaeon]|nr:hypothetical protein [Thermoplasmata archaeon]
MSSARQTGHGLHGDHGDGSVESVNSVAKPSSGGAA